MSATLPIIILPYAADIVVKLSSIFMDRQVMTSALRNLANLPKPQSASFNLNSDQQELIVDHLCSSSLKSATVITAFTSSSAAILIVHDAQAVPWIDWTLLAFLVIGASMIWWVYPRPISYFMVKGKYSIDRKILVTLAFCIYDITLAGLSILALHYQNHQVPKSAFLTHLRS